MAGVTVAEITIIRTALGMLRLAEDTLLAYPPGTDPADEED